MLINQKPSGAEGMTLDKVLKTSDIITLHIPSKDSNRLFMNEEKIFFSSFISNFRDIFSIYYYLFKN